MLDLFNRIECKIKFAEKVTGKCISELTDSELVRLRKISIITLRQIRLFVPRPMGQPLTKCNAWQAYKKATKEVKEYWDYQI